MDGAEKKTCGLHKCEPIQLLFPGRTADPLHSGIVFLAVDGDDQIRSRCKHPVLPYQPESVWKPPDPLWIEDMQVVKLRYVRTLLPSSRQHDGVIEQGIFFLQSLNDAKRELFKRAELSKHKRRDVFQLNHCAELLFQLLLIRTSVFQISNQCGTGHCCFLPYLNRLKCASVCS